MSAIVLHRHGGPEELKLENRAEAKPGPGEVLVSVAYAGVNFMDIGVRKGMLWRDQALPFVPGVEGAGTILTLGEGVNDLAVGQRVAWPYVQGSYTQQLIASAASLVPLPSEISDEIAAAAMMQGLTASHIAIRFYETRSGDVALVHAAAGGVGSLLTQIVKMRGGSVIARVSSAEKVEAAKAAGADHVIVDSDGKFADQVRELTGGVGVNVVFDGSGATTFDDSLASLRPIGTLAYFGPVLGAPPPINIAAMQNSIKIGFPKYSDSLLTRQNLLARSEELFEWIRSGALKIAIGNIYPLADAALAHADLESRKTTGKLLLRA